jgi:hypothetical protein
MRYVPLIKHEKPGKVQEKLIQKNAPVKGARNLKEIDDIKSFTR